MIKKIGAVLAIIVVNFSLSGCSTLADARAAKGTGISREYKAPIDAVWKAIPPVLAELSLPLVGDNRQEGYILAQRGVTAFSYGENVAIFVDSTGSVATTKVEVVSKKAMSTNLFAPEWGKEILDKLDTKLK